MTAGNVVVVCGGAGCVRVGWGGGGGGGGGGGEKDGKEVEGEEKELVPIGSGG